MTLPVGLSELYDQRYREESYRSRLSGYEVARSQALAHFILQVVRPSDPARVLDYGAGSGLYLELWERLFPRAALSFCDISPAALTQLRERYPRHKNNCLPVTKGEVESEPERFDLVVSVEVMEHVEDLDAYLQDIRRVLKPGGCFIWTTPCANPLSIEHLYSLARGQIDPTSEGYRRWRWEDPTHLRRLETAETAKVLTRNGFLRPQFRLRSHFFSFVCTRAPGLGVFGLRERLMGLDYALFRRFPNGASMLGAAFKPRSARR